MTEMLDPKAKRERPDLKTGAARKKRSATEAAQRWKPEAGAAHAGEAQRGGENPKEKPLRKAKRWNK